MDTHNRVRHPDEILQKKEVRLRKQNKLLYWNDLFLQWVTDHVLASVILFDVALIVPLLVIKAPDSIKITLGVISGSWIQWWALPALQRSQNKTQAQNEAKAQVDHETLTYLANAQDDQLARLEAIEQKLTKLLK